jgi:hypothetical protein
MYRLVLIAVVILAGFNTLQACPLCREAVTKSSGAEAEDQLREARAYNYSIYAMVSLPYLLVGGMGFFVYRHLRQRAALEAAFLENLSEGGSASCPPPSPGEDS